MRIDPNREAAARRLMARLGDDLFLAGLPIQPLPPRGASPRWRVLAWVRQARRELREGRL